MLKNPQSLYDICINTAVADCVTVCKFCKRNSEICLTMYSSIFIIRPFNSLQLYHTVLWHSEAISNSKNQLWETFLFVITSHIYFRCFLIYRLCLLSGSI
ncbi:hypothetical protein NQ317_000298 [Molorchus minor]|uniref:Uncharacterized protein n=1 Tax=Molorchus minor TaxID=1323400 RepID=A0ABQ9JD82_9CUCU|nr:hypothetical protein NQ317_000298 [Molorchus minor]